MISDRYVKAAEFRQAILDCIAIRHLRSSVKIAEALCTKRQHVHNIVSSMISRNEISRSADGTLVALVEKTRSAKESIDVRKQASAKAKLTRANIGGITISGRVTTNTCSSVLQHGDRGRGQTHKVRGYGCSSLDIVA